MYDLLRWGSRDMLGRGMLNILDCDNGEWIFRGLYSRRSHANDDFNGRCDVNVDSDWTRCEWMTAVVVCERSILLLNIPYETRETDRAMLLYFGWAYICVVGLCVAVYVCIPASSSLSSCMSKRLGISRN